MLSCQFQNSVVAVGIVDKILDAGHWCYSAVIVRGSFLQLLGHSHFSEHRAITASNAMLDSCRTHVCGHQEDRVIVRYRDTFGARRPPSSQALPSDQVFHEKAPHTFTHTQILHARTHTGTPTDARAHTDTHARTHAHTHARTHTATHTHTRTRTCACTHACTRPNTRTRASSPRPAPDPRGQAVAADCGESMEPDHTQQALTYPLPCT